MINVSPLIISNLPYGLSSPAVGRSIPKAKGIATPEDAVAFLKLVNVGKTTLASNEAFFKKSPEVLMDVARRMKDILSNGV